MTLKLDQADAIITGALAHAAQSGLKPLTVVVLDAGGHLISAKRQDGSGIARFEIAFGKAWGALGLGVSSRAIGAANADRVAFLASAAVACGGRFVPVAGGVLIAGTNGVCGAVGVSGDLSDADEAAALAGLDAAGLNAA